MATNAPSHPCFVCGGKLEWEVVERHREPWEPVLYGPTDWRQLPHTCPPGAAEKFYAEAFERGRKEPRTFPILVSKERLAEQIAADPDIECGAGPSVSRPNGGTR